MIRQAIVSAKWEEPGKVREGIVEVSPGTFLAVILCDFFKVFLFACVI